MADCVISRKSAYASIFRRLEIFQPESISGQELDKISRCVLSSYGSVTKESSSTIIDFVQQQLSSVQSFFTE